MSDAENRLRRLKFRAWHRGTREADYMIGCFFDRYGAGWNEAEVSWFERLLEEEDVDILGWALGTLAIPE
jgi:antitoxin CptB